MFTAIADLLPIKRRTLKSGRDIGRKLPESSIVYCAQSFVPDPSITLPQPFAFIAETMLGASQPSAALARLRDGLRHNHVGRGVDRTGARRG
ncbi:MAG: hypothetical protein NNA18_11200 [Nitrospira sp.]|nr:hypothetical protein [Nitrospira sp.]